MTKKTPDFQKTLEWMLKTPPKENKPLNHSERKSAKKKKQAAPPAKKKST